MISVTDPVATNRPLPHIEAGALIGIRASSGTYRFLLPGGDARQLSRTINALAVKQHGIAGASSDTPGSWPGGRTSNVAK